jgi:septum formation protein
LLRAAGQRFDCVSSDVDEAPRPREGALDYTLRVARDKAREAALRCPGRWVLAADTIVIIDGQVLGKPRDAAEAASMLRRLSGRSHEVATAFVLRDDRGEVFRERVVQTKVVFRTIEAESIAAYVAGGEPFDKAGAYAIQGGGARFVAEVRGSRSNVIGLPMDEVEEALRAADLWIPRHEISG